MKCFEVSEIRCTLIDFKETSDNDRDSIQENPVKIQTPLTTVECELHRF